MRSPFATVKFIQKVFVGNGAASRPQNALGCVAPLAMAVRLGIAVESGANEITVAGSTSIGGGPPSESTMNGGDPAVPDEPPPEAGAEPEAPALPVLPGE